MICGQTIRRGDFYRDGVHFDCTGLTTPANTVVERKKEGPMCEEAHYPLDFECWVYDAGLRLTGREDVADKNQQWLRLEDWQHGLR